MTLTLVVRDAGLTQVDLHAIAMTFSSVKVNGVARATWTAVGGKLLVPVCEGADCPPHAPGDTLVVAVTYSCNPTAGFYRYLRNSYTFAEPYEARNWWPCYDEPSDKAMLDLYATVPNVRLLLLEWRSGRHRAGRAGLSRVALAGDAPGRHLPGQRSPSRNTGG